MYVISPNPPNFFEMTFSLKENLKNHLVLLDIDGTITSEGSWKLNPAREKEFRKLGKKNLIYLCSNKKDDARNEFISKQLGVHYLKTSYRKPNPRILETLPTQDRMRSKVVIGDKWLTDGWFAKRIGARFIKVEHLIGANELWWVKIIYKVDDWVSGFMHVILFI